MILINKTSDSRFVTRKGNIFNDQSNVNYDAGNEIIYNTKQLRSNLYEYDDSYILVKSGITVLAAPLTEVAFLVILMARQVVYCFILKMKYLILIIIL